MENLKTILYQPIDEEEFRQLPPEEKPQEVGELNSKLLPGQELFVYSVLQDPEAKYTWYVSGFGGGKTWIGCNCAIDLSLQYPYNRGVIARNTYENLKNTTIKTFFEVLEQRLPKNYYKYNKVDKLVTFKNGSEIIFAPADNIERLKSLEIGFFYLDEVNEIPYSIFRIFQGRLRKKNVPRRIGFITSNSEGRNWTWKAFYKDHLRNKKYAAIKTYTTDNVYLPEDYIDALMEYPDDLKKRYVYASFDVFEGQIYPEFEKNVHSIDSFNIPASWSYAYGLDHGTVNPTSFHIYRIDFEGNIYATGEYYSSGIVPEHAKNIKELCRSNKVDNVIADPSIFAANQAGYKSEEKKTPYSIAHLYVENGICCTRANNSVKQGIDNVRKFLKVRNDKIHPVTGKEGSPSFFVFRDKCPKMAEEFENYMWDSPPAGKEDWNNPERPKKKDDHAMDECRYVLMEHEALLKPEKRKPHEDLSPETIFKKDIEHLKFVQAVGQPLSDNW